MNRKELRTQKSHYAILFAIFQVKYEDFKYIFHIKLSLAFQKINSTETEFVLACFAVLAVVTSTPGLGHNTKKKKKNIYSSKMLPL